MTIQNVIRRGSLLMLLVLVLLWPKVAFAQTVVLCDSGDDLQAAIDSLDPTVRNHLLVNGTCVPISRGFRIQGFVNLRLEGPATLAHTPEACGVGVVRDALRITDSDVVWVDLIITGGRGVTIVDSNLRADVAEGRPVSVTNSSRDGINVTGESGSRLRLQAGDEVAFNCRNGIRVGEGSRGGGAAYIHDNGGFGLRAVSNGFIEATGTVENNAFGGLFGSAGSRVLVFGSALISGNGNNADPTNFAFPFRGGVTARLGAVVTIAGPSDGSGGPVISGNTGPGVLLHLNTTVSVRGDVTIQGNPDGGVILTQASVAEFNTDNGPISVTNNGTGQIGDVFCDNYSQVFGDVTGVTSNKCQLQGGGGQGGQGGRGGGGGGL